MIQATDLRIGNYYLLNSRVIELDEELMYEIFTPYTGASLASLEPIPLSPEVLEACGFVEDRDRYDGETIIFRLGCTELHHDEDQPLTGYSIAVYDDGNICFAGHDIRYLHQLMNLHHALTGTELTINLEQVKV